MKKRGFGIGKWNGYGGKVLPKESIRSAAARELCEESGLVVATEDFEQMALVDFYFDEMLIFKCHVFIARRWKGVLNESEEMKPQWYNISQLPFDEMWIADSKWLPLILSGKKITATVHFNANGDELKNFSWFETQFS